MQTPYSKELFGIFILKWEAFSC